MVYVIVAACHELGVLMSEMRIEAMHMSSNPRTASNALRIETKGQRYKKTCYQRKHGPLHRD